MGNLLPFTLARAPRETSSSHSQNFPPLRDFYGCKNSVMSQILKLMYSFLYTALQNLLPAHYFITPVAKIGNLKSVSYFFVLNGAKTALWATCCRGLWACAVVCRRLVLGLRGCRFCVMIALCLI